MADKPVKDAAWLKKQVDEYAGTERPRYMTYAEKLHDVFKAACKRYAPDGIVQSRAKTVASFAEKVIRKIDKYDNPVRQFTDLCGVRVIVHTQEQVEAICQFIQDNFRVDERNSGDAAALLDDSEFGYLSNHLIVQCRAEKEVLGVSLAGFGDCKAEIQVRTLLQHAWADITHDRLYKSSFKPPARLKRLAARVAAVLEEADATFADFELAMQEYMGNYTAFLSDEELRKEISVQSQVLGIEKEPGERAAVALKLARVARAAGELSVAINALKEFVNYDGPESLQIKLELGSALVDLHRDKPKCAEFRDGQQYLLDATGNMESGADLDKELGKIRQKLRAAAAAKLAESYVWAPKQDNDAGECYRVAVARDPLDPYHLASLLAHRLKTGGDWGMLDGARPAILDAIDQCRDHAAAKLQLPHAWLTMGRLFLLLHQPRETYDAMDSFAKAIWFCRTKKLKWPCPRLQSGREPDHCRGFGKLTAAERQAATGCDGDFAAEFAFFEQIWGTHRPPERQWAEGLLSLGRCATRGCRAAIPDALKKAQLFTGFRGRRVLIIAGGAAQESEQWLRQYEPALTDALDGFDGVVISGGTTAGIPGLVGRIAAKLHARGGKKFRLIGYHPLKLRADALKDTRNYDELLNSDGDQLGAEEPICNWIDILAGGIDVSTVRVLGIEGGSIARFEYAIALAMGATVGVVESSGRSAGIICADPDWSAVAQLLPLPHDWATLRAFVQPGGSWCDESTLTAMGRYAHETYMNSLTKRDPANPSHVCWNCLSDEFKEANMAQPRYIRNALRRCNYDAVPESNARPAVRIAETDIDSLAEMEHGRWNLERLMVGWRYGSERNDPKKRHPFLLPWNELPEKARNKDRDAVRSFAKMLEFAKYKIVRA